MIVKTKVCTRCQIEQPTDNFHKHKLGRGGLNPKCNSCRNKSQQQSREKNGYAAQLKYKYGITYQDFLLRVAAQDNRCLVCSTEFNSSFRTTTPCVDHSHTTGRVRGILCHPCNVAIGLVKENPQTLLNMVQYLK